MKNREFQMILVILIVAVTISILCKIQKKEGDFVIVSVDGVETAAYSLHADCQIPLTTYNSGQNFLLIKNGMAAITDANCQDHLCVKQGGISKTGESIVCLPNRLIVEIQGNQSEEQHAVSFDAMAE